jgi:hypothetical protein
MEKNGGGWTVSDAMLLVAIIRWQELIMANKRRRRKKCDIDYMSVKLTSKSMIS